MKKFLSLLLVCAMLGLTACGSGNDDAEPNTDEQVENGSEDKNASKEIDWSKYENQANVILLWRKMVIRMYVCLQKILLMVVRSMHGENVQMITSHLAIIFSYLMVWQQRNLK